MEYRIDSKDKCVDDPIEISLEDALKEIEDFPTEDEYKGGFIGFEMGDKIIQFVRFDNENWLIDIPEYTRDDIVSRQARVTTQQVIKIVTLFSKGEDIRQEITEIRLIYTSTSENYGDLPREQRETAVRREYKNEIICKKCGNDLFQVNRVDIAQIELKCKECGTTYLLEVDISEEEDGTEPVITFT